MSVYKSKKSPYWQYDFQTGGHRFHGSTECTSCRDAEKCEAVEREKAKALVKATRRSRSSLLIDDVAGRLWNDSAQHDADPDATDTNLARLIEYFGKAMPLTDIGHNEGKQLVAWRRGHRIKDREDAALISNATVNRSTIKVLQRLFTFAKSEGAVFDNEPKWKDLLLPEPVERVRELQDDEAAAFDEAMRDDYGPFFDFVRTSGLRQKECVTLRWSEVNFGTGQIVRLGKGGRRVVFPITKAIRNSFSAARPALGFRVHLCCGLRQQATGEGPRATLCAHAYGCQNRLAADAHHGRREGLPLSRLPA